MPIIRIVRNDLGFNSQPAVTKFRGNRLVKRPYAALIKGKYLTDERGGVRTFKTFDAAWTAAEQEMEKRRNAKSSSRQSGQEADPERRD